MRITIDIDDKLLASAKADIRLADTSAVVHEALKMLVAREAARQLALLGGTQPQVSNIPRRRSALLRN